MALAALFDLSGRTALVTGGSRGIGRFLADGLAEAGAHVLVCSRKSEACETAAAEIRRAGGQATALPADVADPESIEALVLDAIAVTGRVDILVNNAARAWSAPSMEYPLDGWDRVFDLNVRGAFWLSRLLAPQMKEHGGGSIINVSSLSAQLGASDDEQPIAAYPASKGALEAMTRDLAVKWAPHGIRVNAIQPGPFDTDMLAHIKADPAVLAHHNAQVPLGRPGSPADMKGVGVFLASDASAFVTGSILRVDGGVAAVYPVKKQSA
jgi:gluconate 5-dehydrogenase